jgi:hypothetical protein
MLLFAYRLRTGELVFIFELILLSSSLLAFSSLLYSSSVLGFTLELRLLSQAFGSLTFASTGAFGVYFETFVVVAFCAFFFGFPVPGYYLWRCGD